MFHQVLVPEKYGSLLRFLWWEDHNINNNIADFEVGIHVGGASSPSCCSYALKRTALENEEKYQKEMTHTLRRNFYLDDLLKSVRDVNTAICLLHEIMKVCAEGGFRLTKFVSNKVEVLQSIPEVEKDSSRVMPRFGRLIDCSLHHFSDASQDVYSQVS